MESLGHAATRTGHGSGCGGRSGDRELLAVFQLGGWGWIQPAEAVAQPGRCTGPVQAVSLNRSALSQVELGGEVKRVSEPPSRLDQPLLGEVIIKTAQMRFHLVWGHWKPQ